MQTMGCAIETGFWLTCRLGASLVIYDFMLRNLMMINKWAHVREGKFIICHYKLLELTTQWVDLKYAQTGVNSSKRYAGCDIITKNRFNKVFS